MLQTLETECGNIHTYSQSKILQTLEIEGSKFTNVLNRKRKHYSSHLYVHISSEQLSAEKASDYLWVPDLSRFHFSGKARNVLVSF